MMNLLTMGRRISCLMTGLCFGLLFVFNLSTSLQAQTGTSGKASLKIDSFSARFVEFPRISSTRGTDESPNYRDRRYWLRLVVTYTTTEEWIDDLQVNFYLLTPPPSASRERREEVSSVQKQVVLTGSESYTLVSAGEHAAEMYIHPQYLKKYGMSEGYNDPKMAVELLINGKVVAVQSVAKDEALRKKADWWKSVAPAVSGVIQQRKNTPWYVVEPYYFELTK